jgi:Uma2 family endonuclease
MSRTATQRFETAADLFERLGNIAPERVRMQPLPGTATEKDLIRFNDRTDRLYELVDGTLVEKVMGYPESLLAVDIIQLLGPHVRQHDLGALAGADGGMRLMAGLVRLPDVSFLARARFPDGHRPTEPVAGLAPDLAIEVLSAGNTPGEMARKLKEYFLSGVRVVWFVDMRKFTVEVFTAPDQSTLLGEDEVIDGGDVLPGLALPVREVFAQVPHVEAKRAARSSGPRRGRRKPGKGG